MQEYITEAQKLFQGIPSDKLSFACHKGEDPLQAAPGSLDLITAAEALHWSDVSAVIPNLAQYLKPGGTLAVWMYGTNMVYPPEPANPSAHLAYKNFCRSVMVVLEKTLSIRMPGAVMTSRLDCMDLDPSSWTGIRRLYSNIDVDMIRPGWETLPSKVRPEESQEYTLAQDFHSTQADFEWIRHYYNNLFPGFSAADVCKDELEALRVAMGDSTMRRKLYWPFVLILATKK